MSREYERSVYDMVLLYTHCMCGHHIVDHEPGEEHRGACDECECVAFDPDCVQAEAGMKGAEQ